MLSPISGWCDQIVNKGLNIHLHGHTRCQRIQLHDSLGLCVCSNPGTCSLFRRCMHEMPCQQKQFKHLHNSLKACDGKLPQVADWCCDQTHRGFFANSCICFLTKQDQLHHPPRPLDIGHPG